MKKTLTIILAFVLVLSLAACGASKPATESPAASPAESAAASDATPNFVFCISHMDNDWAVTASDSMTAAAKAAGANLTVNEAGQDINTQVSQIESAINQKADCIIIEPVSADGVLPAVEEASAAGIPVIIFNQNISDPTKATAFVGVSNEDLGYMQMKRACDDIGGKGNVAILTGPVGSEGELGRSAGYKKALAEYPDVKEVFNDDGQWTTENGLKFAENWLQTGTDINAFVCQNDNMAMGCVKAIEDKNLSGQIKVYGLDAVKDALQAVKDGRLTATVSQSTEQQSQNAIDAAMKLFKGEKVDSEILAQGTIIDSANVDQYLK
ncbi:MAG: sugar ABC transporter substrate-binding protein [Oscillospiraceae bacterium]|nr:sugar ABC transporter substrate-binding protein [Oscillospiraceae bacterium]